ncbi:hypothetical protein H6P81_006357 [Aristolochia fimbriata]|uniref:Uncharacterized protein n=1 Tax=Aristolochia fimbriata TaxID=158543 RepID=A0AAV7F1M6_ARIFI|nr:hypothetical protein H6P81_006357 [Aristolochia fimbriata]
MDLSAAPSSTSPRVRLRRVFDSIAPSLGFIRPLRHSSSTPSHQLDSVTAVRLGHTSSSPPHQLDSATPARLRHTSSTPPHQLDSATPARLRHTSSTQPHQFRSATPVSTQPHRLRLATHFRLTHQFDSLHHFVRHTSFDFRSHQLRRSHTSSTPHHTSSTTIFSSTPYHTGSVRTSSTHAHRTGLDYLLRAISISHQPAPRPFSPHHSFRHAVSTQPGHFDSCEGSTRHASWTPTAPWTRLHHFDHAPAWTPPRQLGSSHQFRPPPPFDSRRRARLRLAIDRLDSMHRSTGPRHFDSATPARLAATRSTPPHQLRLALHHFDSAHDRLQTPPPARLRHTSSTRAKLDSVAPVRLCRVLTPYHQVRDSSGTPSSNPLRQFDSAACSTP